MFWTSDNAGGIVAGFWERSLQIHIGDELDSRERGSVEGNWWAAPQAELFLEGSENWEILVVGFGLNLWDGAPMDAPLWMAISCDAPFSVLSKFSGTEGRSFAQHSLRGGIGATVNTPVVDVGLAVADGLSASFGTPYVRFESIIWSAESFGSLYLQHPDGVEEWDIRPDGPRTAKFQGTSGDYVLRLDMVAGDARNRPLGILIGASEVESLEEIIQEG